MTAFGLRVGFVPGVTLTKWRRIWSDRFRRIPLEVVEVAESDQRSALMEGRVDMCFVRLPIDRTDLHAIPLYDEVPVVVAAKDHPISLFAEVTWADLADELLLDPADPDAVDLAVGGAGVLAVPQSVAREQSRRDLDLPADQRRHPHPGRAGLAGRASQRAHRGLRRDRPGPYGQQLALPPAASAPSPQPRRNVVTAPSRRARGVRRHVANAAGSTRG